MALVTAPLSAISHLRAIVDELLRGLAETALLSAFSQKPLDSWRPLVATGIPDITPHIRVKEHRDRLPATFRCETTHGSGADPFEFRHSEMQSEHIYLVTVNPPVPICTPATEAA